jgi:hypothetical protein
LASWLSFSPDLPAGALKVSTNPGQQVGVNVSVVDNITGDPVFIAAVPAP